MHGISCSRPVSAITIEPKPMKMGGSPRCSHARSGRLMASFVPLDHMAGSYEGHAARFAASCCAAPHNTAPAPDSRFSATMPRMPANGVVAPT